MRALYYCLSCEKEIHNYHSSINRDGRMYVFCSEKCQDYYLKGAKVKTEDVKKAAESTNKGIKNAIKELRDD